MSELEMRRPDRINYLSLIISFLSVLLLIGIWSVATRAAIEASPVSEAKKLLE